MEQLLNRLPEYAKDLKLNLGSVLRQTELTPSQTWGTAVACAIACRNPQLLEAVLAEARQHLTPEALNAAKAAAAIMSMNNIYYRFHHLSENPKYAASPARLRMNVVRTHGANPVDFELWSTAVSAINGCAKCVSAHEHVLREKGVSEETILASIRIASVFHGAAVVLDTETVSESVAV